jgi:CelD/BcsL family acetyltransferase involved in cellulose biosynthesis
MVELILPDWPSIYFPGLWFSMSLVVSRKRFDQLGVRELEAWKDLLPADALSASLFMHPEFCEAAHRVLGLVEVVVIEDHGSVVGVVPLNRAHGIRGWLRGYTQVAQDISDGFCFPVHDGYLDRVPYALVKVGVWSGFFTHFAMGKRIPDLQVGAATKTYLVRRQGGNRDMWDELKERSRKFWSDTERCARRLNELPGGYEFHWQSPNPERDLETLIALKLDQYARTGMQGSALFREGIKEFLRTLASKKTAGFSAPLNVLYCGDQLIAAHLGLLGSGRLHYWFPVYEATYAKYSPGKVLLSEVMKHCIFLGIDVIDLGEGQADYKEAAATETHDLAKASIAQGVRGALSILPLRWAWRMKRRN